ncbi:SDR family oxidoreductase [Paenibacillus artemisiicola]|uniref:SDR family oxidoreductase n=1 Tax=Paenibacillus artemisiicola TaxID=1172618 RepID=UPI001F0A6F90|nr:SDR family oxidoreductase [Paenibacillus artemisiicola]
MFWEKPQTNRYAPAIIDLNYFVDNAGQGLHTRGIRVNSVAPGAIMTDFAGGTLRNNSALQAQISSVTALGRAGEADDIEGVIAAICSPEMGRLNAQRIEASGGMFL